MLHPYTEDQLCEQPAIELFAELRWETAGAFEEIFGPAGTLGREIGSMDRLNAIADAVERLISPDPICKEFFTLETSLKN